MKKIFKFIGPNGEYVKWGEFNGEKQILTLEVEEYCDDGVLLGKKAIDFILPENIDMNSKLNIISSYENSGFLRSEAPDQQIVDKAEDNREFLAD